MTRKLLAMIGCMALLGTSQAGATSITYNVSGSVGTLSDGILSFSGTITTSSSAIIPGFLGPGDISSWDITITGFSETFILQPGPDNFIEFVGTSDLLASSTTLSWNTSSNAASTFPSEFLIEEEFSAPHKAFILFQQSSVDDVSVLTIDAENSSGGLEHNQDLVASDTFGTAAAAGVPGPIAGAGLPGLVFAGAGFLAWWRRKRTASGALAVV
jgi:hypothetical protein